LALPAQADDTEGKLEISASAAAHKEETFPTDTFGYENPEDVIQAYYEYKKGCTNDCEAGFIRQLAHTLV
jgi:hypothetical protein